jgi:hypothetical protein
MVDNLPVTPSPAVGMEPLDVVSGIQNRTHAARQWILPLASWSAKYSVRPVESTRLGPTPGTTFMLTVAAGPAGAVPGVVVVPVPLAQPATANTAAASHVALFHRTMTPPWW